MGTRQRPNCTWQRPLGVRPICLEVDSQWELHGFMHIPILFLRHDFDGRSKANLESN